MKFTRIIQVAFVFFVVSTTAQSQFSVWRNILESDSWAIEVNPLNPNTLYTFHSASFDISRDGGESWTQHVNVNINSVPSCYQIFVAPRDTNTIFITGNNLNMYRSTDEGKHWAISIAGFNNSHQGILCDPEHPDTMYAGGTNRKLYQSLDRGSSWTQIATIPVHTVTLAISPIQPHEIWVGGGDFQPIVKTTDFGLTWSDPIPFPPSGFVATSIAVHPTDSLVAYATSYRGSWPYDDGGVWRTTDGGFTWGWLGLIGHSLRKVVIDPAHPETLYVGTYPEIAGGVYRSTDGGGTWVHLGQNNFDQNDTWDIKVDPSHSEKVYIASGSGGDGPGDGIFTLGYADAVVRGVARDSATGVPIASAIFFTNHPDVAVTFDQGSYEAYRSVENPDSSFVMSIRPSFNDHYPADETLHFVRDSVIEHDFYLRAVPSDSMFGSIAGIIFEDVNANGVRDSGEGGLSGWKTVLAGTVVEGPEHHTDSTGAFSYQGLLYGNYEARQQVKRGWRQTFPNSPVHSISLYPPQTVSGINFGNVRRPQVMSTSPVPNSTVTETYVPVSITFSASLSEASLSAPSALVIIGSITGRHQGAIAFSPGDSGLTFTPSQPFHQGEVVTVNVSNRITTQNSDSLISYSYQFMIGPSQTSNHLFHKRLEFAVGGAPGSVAVGDLDRDGDVDVVTSNYADGTVSVLKGSSNGDMGHRIDYPTGQGPQSVIVRDVDLDGVPDIIVANSLEYSIAVLKGVGDGTFAPATNFALGAHPTAITISDIDGDGDEDIHAAQYDVGITYLSNDGAGNFAIESYLGNSGSPYSIFSADLNNDGANDVVNLSYTSTSRIYVFESLEYNYLTLASSHAIGTSPGQIIIADLDGDRLLDIAHSGTFTNKLSIFCQHPDTGFIEAQYLSTGAAPMGIASGDLDGDGRMDIATVNSASSTFSIFMNHGNGNFERADFPSGQGARALAIADIDNDGTLDVVIADAGSNKISVAYNGTSGISSYLNEGWNLVSVPLNVGLADPSLLFPRSSSRSFSFAGSYRECDSIAEGTGYWIKYGRADTIGYGGLLIPRESVAVEQRWNLVGSISTPVAVTGISTSPPGIVTSSFFGYNPITRKYEIADTIRPGSGYYVKSGSPGVIVLSSFPENIPAAARIQIVGSDEMPPPAPDDALITQDQEVKEFALNQNYPNPFNPTTQLRYSIASAGHVTLRIYDVLGRELVTLVDEEKGVGNFSVGWDASGVSSGIYFSKLDANGFTSTRKMLLLR